MKKICIHRTSCCGVRLLTDVQYHRLPCKTILYAYQRMFITSRVPFNCAIVMLNDNSASQASSKKLAKYITDNELGHIKDVVINGKSTLMWEVNHKNLHKWFKHNKR